MAPRFAVTGVASVLVVVACSSITGDVCACPPAFSGKAIAGSVLDAKGAPIANALLLIRAVPPREPGVEFPDSVLFFDAKTKTDGSFAGRLRLFRGPTDSAEVHLGVYRTASSKPIHIVAGTVTGFTLNSFGPDTARFTIQLPP